MSEKEEEEEVERLAALTKAVARAKEAKAKEVRKESSKELVTGVESGVTRRAGAATRTPTWTFPFFVRDWYSRGATAQKTVDIPVMYVLFIFDHKFLQSMRFTGSYLKFSSSSECGPFLLCSGGEYAQRNLCRRLEIPRYWCSSWVLSTCPSLCNDRRRGAASAFGTAAVVEEEGWKAVCSCFQAGSRSSSHR